MLALLWTLSLALWGGAAGLQDDPESVPAPPPALSEGVDPQARFEPPALEPVPLPDIVPEEPASAVASPALEPFGPGTIADAPGPTQDRPSKLRKDQRMGLGAAAMGTVGLAAQWGALGGTGALSADRPRRGDPNPGMVIGLALGGVLTLDAVMFSGFAAKERGKYDRGVFDEATRRRRARTAKASGGALMGLGAATMLGTGLAWPTLREACPAGIGCNVAGLHAGGLLLGGGVALLSYGNNLSPDRRRPRLSATERKARTPIYVGAGLVTYGYVMAAFTGLIPAQSDPDDARLRRIRDRMLIPIVGPWIVAAGPDAPLFFAMFTGGIGALQIGGSIAMLAGGIRLGVQRKRRSQTEIAVLPSANGVSVVGRF